MLQLYSFSRPNCLVLRGLNLETVVERLFSLPDKEERELWYQAITKVGEGGGGALVLDPYEGKEKEEGELWYQTITKVRGRRRGSSGIRLLRR